MKTINVIMLVSLAFFSLQSGGANITEEGLIQSITYMKRSYYPIIADLREGHQVRRDAIDSLLDGDPLFNRQDQPGGHRAYSHRDFSVHLGTNRGNETLSAGERKGILIGLQVYSDAFKRLIGFYDKNCYTNQGNPQRAVHTTSLFGHPARFYIVAEGVRRYNSSTRKDFQGLFNQALQNIEGV